MDRERWATAKSKTQRPKLEVRNAVFTAVGAVVVGVPVAIVHTGAAIAIGGALGGILGYVLSIYWDRIWAYAREPISQLEDRVRELENRPGLGVIVPQVPAISDPIIVVSPAPGDSYGRLYEFVTKSVFRRPGRIYVSLKVNVGTGSDQPAVLITRIKAFLQFDNEPVVEFHSSHFNVIDATMSHAEEDSAPVKVWQNGMYELTCEFGTPAKAAIPEVDGENMKFHLPEIGRIVGVVVYDSLNREYPLVEGGEFSIRRIDEREPF